jgi:hypothetical protein
VRQILYISTSTVPGDKADLVGILEQSRHNNAIDGVTGLLWSDGRHFMQVIEGPKASISDTFARIQVDTRHERLEVLHDRPIEDREFGGWSMAHRRANDPADIYDAQMHRLLSRASPSISKPFFDLMNNGRADS